MKELLNKPLPEIPAEIREQLDNSQITLTPLEEMNEILANSTLQQEVGYRRYAMFVDSTTNRTFILRCAYAS